MAPQTAPGTRGDFEDLVHRLEQLEARVRHLEEGHAEQPAPVEFRVPTIADELHLPETAEGIVPLLGKALLALAGAYLLRAIATSSLAPHWIGMSLAVAYPVFWMAMASRLSIANRVSGSVYMVISVLAFAPMLWETTVNLHLLTTETAALAVAGYVILGVFLAWREQLNAIAWLSTTAGAVTALALCFGTYDLAPFVFALLASAAALEVAAVRGMWLGPRRLVALAADLAILWLIDIYGRGGSLPEGYHAVPAWLGWGAPAALLVIFMAGIATRTLRRHLDATVFETLELLTAVALFVFAATRQQRAALLVPGAIALACGVLCYVLAFVRLVKESHQINLYAYSVFGLALVLVGTVFALPAGARPVLWAMASVGLLWIPARAAAISALAYIAAASAASGLAWDAWAALLRDATPAALTMGALAAFLAMVVAAVKLRGALRAIAAAMFVWVAVALLGSLLPGALPAAADLAWRTALRTVLVVAAAVGVAAVARYRRVPELYWLVPGAMVIALARLAIDDMPVSRPETIFVSLLFYGGALLVLSKLMHNWRSRA